MKYENNKVSEIKLAYIGGGSRGWAWGFMSDLVSADDISGEVRLYDIDKDAAKRNEIIGNKYNNAEGAKSHWDYVVKDSLKDALTGADFVIISILPGTFDEMESDVHTPEKYGIYQSVGDTVGAGGIVRALRTMPMYEEIGLAIKDYCPEGLGYQLHQPHDRLRKDPLQSVPRNKSLRLLPRSFRHAKVPC